MRKKFFSLMVAASFVAVPLMAGCEREVSHEKHVTETPSGKTKVEENKTVEKPDGSVETTKEKKTVDPNK